MEKINGCGLRIILPKNFDKVLITVTCVVFNLYSPKKAVLSGKTIQFQEGSSFEMLRVFSEVLKYKEIERSNPGKRRETNKLILQSLSCFQSN